MEQTTDINKVIEPYTRLLHTKNMIGVDDIYELNGFHRFEKGTIQSWVADIWSYCLSKKCNDFDNILSYVRNSISSCIYMAMVNPQLVDAMVSFLSCVSVRYYTVNDETYIIPAYPCNQYKYYIDNPKFDILKQKDNVIAYIEEWRNNIYSKVCRKYCIDKIKSIEKNYGYSKQDIQDMNDEEIIELTKTIKLKKETK